MRRVTRTKKSLVEKRSRSDRDQFQSAAFLNEHYFEFQRELACPESRDLEDWKRWRRKLRGALRKTLCLDELGKAPTPRPVVEEEIETADYIRQKVVYETFAAVGSVHTCLFLPGDLRGKRLSSVHTATFGVRRRAWSIQSFH